MLKIRKADSNDMHPILGLYAQPKMDNGNVIEVEAAQAIFKRMQSYPNYHLYVAVSNECIVGTFALLIMDNIGHQGSPSGIIEDVVVDASCQGQGIGRQMMQYAYEECQKAGCYKMMLSSNLKRTDAHAFYESLGFEKHGFSFRVSSKEK
ncbi:MAG: GNAT family N-acetyltransferase [Pseudomonadota bacterium]